MPSTSTTFLGFKLRRWRCWCSDGARRRSDYFRRLNKGTHSHQSQHQLHRKPSCAEEVIRERKRGKYSKDRTETQDLKRTRKFNELRTSLRSLGLLPGLFLLNLSDLIKQSSTILVTLILTFLGFRMKNLTLIESINQSSICLILLHLFCWKTYCMNVFTEDWLKSMFVCKMKWEFVQPWWSFFLYIFEVYWLFWFTWSNLYGLLCSLAC